jgi:hypothetical protein
MGEIEPFDHAVVRKISRLLPFCCEKKILAPFAKSSPQALHLSAQYFRKGRRIDQAKTNDQALTASFFAPQHGRYV